ncbi:MAG: hypothetical protein A4E55_00161 [Pelotomaculum sp. PtaU1.Bin035]|nr:MAG: hypothetical protein A4E54_02050 [Pelotomaculum sp. PtaB.Bin117]OPY59543.1 MAG: hypothetical protein A4E55_00161 [Pelotomaculum sp. PtaU1.Bin035]
MLRTRNALLFIIMIFSSIRRFVDRLIPRANIKDI